MRFLILIYLLTTTMLSFSQEFKQEGNIKYNNESVIIENYKLQKGDSVYLGFGSGSNKQFVFLFFRPNVLTYDANKGLEGLTPMYANSTLVIKEIKVKKAFGKEYLDVIYTLSGRKIAIGADLYNAFKAGEIKGFSQRCLISNQ